MSNLQEIGNKSLSTLPMLEELYCTNNPILYKIAPDAFSALDEFPAEGLTYPPLKKVYFIMIIFL